MNRIKGTKCDFGYITQQKKFQSLMLGIFIAIGIVIFLVGLLATHTRANIFTVLAILMVLPATKRIIALVVMVPRKSVSKDVYDKMKNSISKEATLLTDYVFTSSEKIMSLSFVVIQDKHVIGIPDEKKQDVKYMSDYLRKCVNEKSSDYQVKILESVDDFDAFYKRSGLATSTDTSHDEVEKEVIKYLKILAV